MNAAPGTVFENLDFVRRRIAGKELGVIYDAGQFVRLDVMQSVGQSHLAPRMMMPITLAVGRDVHQLRPVALVGQPAHQSIGKRSSVIEQTFEGHRSRNRSIVEKESHLSAS